MSRLGIIRILFLFRFEQGRTKLDQRMTSFKSNLFQISSIKLLKYLASKIETQVQNLASAPVLHKNQIRYLSQDFKLLKNKQNRVSSELLLII